MSRRYDCTNTEQRAAGIADAASAIRAGELVVIPTDTVYGIGADAFTPSAVTALLEAKGRGRDMPVPVLVGTVRAAAALVDDLGSYGQDLIDTFWPGPLTLICRASRSLNWDLGDTKGTVAIRMPLHAVALELLKETGPMAVSSANRSGAPPATTAADAEEQLGESVAVYLDGGACSDSVPSTIIDLTTAVPRVLRKGAIPVEKLRGVIGYVATDAGPDTDISGTTGATEALAAAAEPEKPAAIEPEKPADAIEPEKPADATEKSAETAEPEKPAEAAEPEKPADEVGPEQPIGADEPEKPTEAAESEKPADAAEPQKPVGADEPGPADKPGPAGGSAGKAEGGA
ncbi:L-threonylcarbamoyladenylate synthase [Sphaerisporangium perillae]|uniref:L-threonylcarbamoyladenylate synthase n=1 Tax=Sphaerisporangium perillae TaxID=2935860 RepID=UPI0035581C5D